MRRRRGARHARQSWLSGWTAPLARAASSQVAWAALNPRAGRMIDLLELGPGRRYLDIGCGSASFAHLLARSAGLEEPPVTVDLAHGPAVDVVGWPEQLPFPDDAFDAITSLHILRRFDDDVVHNFALEIARVLAPGGRALVSEFAPVKWGALDAVHRRLVSPGCEEVDLRGWGRLAALLTECGFGAIDLVELGPYALPPMPRVSVLIRQLPGEGTVAT